MTRDADISSDDYELAEAALAATDTQPRESIAPALRMLRDECGWAIGKAKRVLELIQISRGG